jgi:hypothetical protein
VTHRLEGNDKSNSERIKRQEEAESVVSGEGGRRVTNYAHHLLRECLHGVSYRMACADCKEATK